MKVPILYLDTSIVGGYFDPPFQVATRELWRQMNQGKYQFLTSVVTEQEIVLAPPAVRRLFDETFPWEERLHLDRDGVELARE